MERARVPTNHENLSSHGSNGASLPELSGIKPIYFLPADPMADEVLIPSFAVSDRVDNMAGFFSSGALASLAPGLASFINQSSGKLRLLIGPLIRPEDKAAIEEGSRSPTEIAAELLDELVFTEDLIEQHTLKCLSWLLQMGRIEMRVALMKDAMFHPKVWLFHGAKEVLAVHGSSNATVAGIRRNFEQIAVSKSWTNSDQRYITEQFQSQFDSLWSNNDDDCIVVAIPDAVREGLLSTYRSKSPPTETELRSLYDRAKEIDYSREESFAVPDIKQERFEVPEEIQFEDGPFAHQGRAVSAWCSAGYSGVLEMATGSGKTITAMICARKLFEEYKPLLIVVSAPYIPLIQQWCDEIEPFGIRPVNLVSANGPSGRARELATLGRRLRHGTAKVAALVVSHRTLADGAFRTQLANLDATKLLIADEVHNLGSEGFISDVPDFFDFRLGLSATPVRQYDQEGTEALFDFIGPVVFQFPLEEAIGTCLVPYDYYVHPVELSPAELNSWHEISERIRANAWRQDDGEPDDYLAKLFRDRRAILETAENKLPALRTALEAEGIRHLRHTLIYATDKAPRQLEQVNSMLGELGLLFHQLTYEETGHRSQVISILRQFQEGQLQALTAKRVLDEGVNIPQVQRAFILASTTVERQWVQRRGRLLRKCSEIGKTHSEIHDFVVVPPGAGDDDERSLAVTELRRVREFASLARNAGSAGGPLEAIGQLTEAAFT